MSLSLLPVSVRKGAEASRAPLCVTDGTLPWTADHERRGLIVRYTPGNTVYASPGGGAWPEEYFEDATDAQKALLEAPYHTVTTAARSPPDAHPS